MSNFVEGDFNDRSVMEIFAKTAQDQYTEPAAQARVATAPTGGKFYVIAMMDDIGTFVDASGNASQTRKIQLGSFSSLAEANAYADNQINQSYSSIYVDTVPVAADPIDGAEKNLLNMSMVENFFNSNAPTLNVTMGLEMVCDQIARIRQLQDTGIPTGATLAQAAQGQLSALAKKAVTTVIALGITAAQNASQQLRRMVIGKINQFLADNIANECMSGLATELEKLQNPANLLSIDELGDSLSSSINKTGEDIAASITATKKSWAAAQNEIALANPLSPFAAENVIKLAGDIDALVEMQLCRQSKSFAGISNPIGASMENQIRGAMQSCVFKQALKTMGNVSPDSIPTAVMTQMDYLTRDGNFADAYSIALAAGLDLSTVGVDLPYQGTWISKADGGNPYIFQPEKPSGIAESATFLMEGMPTTNELMTGNIAPEKMSQPWVSDVATPVTSQSTEAANTLQRLTADSETRILLKQNAGTNNVVATA